MYKDLSELIKTEQKEDSVGKGVGHQAWQSEFKHQSPHGRRRDRQTLQVVQISACAMAHTHTHTHLHLNYKVLWFDSEASFIGLHYEF